MRKLSLIGAALFAFVDAASAAPNPATATFQVLITVQKACSVTAGGASNINFGTVDASATNLSATNNISVTCSKTTPYTIGLAPTGLSTSGAGTMKSATPANTDVVGYQLRSVSAAGAAWGTSSGAVTGTGTGAAQSIPVFATVPSANVTPDSYTDTVTVNVTY